MNNITTYKDAKEYLEERYIKTLNLKDFPDNEDIEKYMAYMNNERD